MKPIKYGLTALLLASLVLPVFSYGQSTPDYTKTPVFFVHGHGMSAGSWSSLIQALESAGYPRLYLQAIQLSPADGANIPAAENQIALAIESFLTSVNSFISSNYPTIPARTKVDIVSHSMGGVSSRWYAAKVRPDRVRKWISLAGANHGTNDLCPGSDPGSDDLCPAYAQNEEESYVQYTLNGAPFAADVDETPYGVGTDAVGVAVVNPDIGRRVLYITVRTSPDEWIDPEESTVFDGAGGVPMMIPEGLPARVTSEGNILMTHGIGHDAMLDDAGTMNMVRYLLDLPMTTLEDAISILRALSGIQQSTGTAHVFDLNEDCKVGLEDALHILQSLSGLR